MATAMVARYVADLECVVSSSCVAFDGFDARPTTIIIINFIDALDSHLLGRTFLTIKNPPYKETLFFLHDIIKVDSKGSQKRTAEDY